MNNVYCRLLAILLAVCTFLLFTACSKNSTGDDNVEEEDSIAPFPISSLTVVSFTDTSVTLSWIAPGDDSMSGTADRYDLRYSTDPITFDNFIDANQVMYCPRPLISGTTQTIEVVGLSMNVRYYFSIIAFDENNNYSYPSNVVDAVPFSDAAISFPDAALEAVIRTVLSQPTGPLMRSSLITIKDIRDEDAGVSNLTGLEYCTSLEGLNLINGSISDLSPLTGLSRLWGLQLYGNNITDLTPLAGITNLVQLNLGANPITSVTPLQSLPNLTLLRLHETTIADYTPIATMTSIEDLDLHSCHLSDISFLSGLTKVRWLQLQVNTISDIAPLSGMTHLESAILGLNNISVLSPLSNLHDLQYISLTRNQVSDLSPLVNNAGIDSGDVIAVEMNPLSQTVLDTQIPALQARGVTVHY